MKLKKVTTTDPIERLAVSIRQSTMNLLNQYQVHYRATYGETIERSLLVEEMLRDYMKSDKAFQAALPSIPVPKPSPQSKSSEEPQS